VQRYAGEEKRLWEDFRHGVIMGTQQFVDRVKSRYISERPHREIPQQRGLVGRINATMLLNKASQLLKCDVEWFREAGRLYGKDKENRDLLVYLFWERGAFTNGEIGDFFGVTYTAVSHIVKEVKGQLKTDRDYRQKYDFVNSQINRLLPKSLFAWSKTFIDKSTACSSRCQNSPFGLKQLTSLIFRFAKIYYQKRFNDRSNRLPFGQQPVKM